MRKMLGAAGVAIALGAAGVAVSALADPRRALLGWLAAFGFGLGTALGALILAMVFHVTNARWPVVVRPHLMAIAGTCPIFALLFLPIAAGLRTAYPWAYAGASGEGSALAHQRLWQAPTFFFARAVIYLLAWSVLSIALARADARHDRAPTEETRRAQQRISAAGLPILALTMTFASFDWLMAVEPGWVSDAYGLYFFAGGLVSAISLVAVVARFGIADAAPTPEHFHAIGRLMLMGTILWAYIAFFQLLLVWIANLPREVGFYGIRSRSGYQIVDAALVLGRFALPFLVLLPRALKRRPSLLALVAAWLVLMDAVDLAWLVLPRAGGGPQALDVAPFVLLGGLVAGAAIVRSRTRFAASRPSPRDPWLAAATRYSSP